MDGLYTFEILRLRGQRFFSLSPFLTPLRAHFLIHNGRRRTAIFSTALLDCLMNIKQEMPPGSWFSGSGGAYWFLETGSISVCGFVMPRNRPRGLGQCRWVDSTWPCAGQFQWCRHSLLLRNIFGHFSRNYFWGFLLNLDFLKKFFHVIVNTLFLCH